MSNPNAIEIHYVGFRWSLSTGVELQKIFTYKSPKGVIEFRGTYTEAREYFRNEYPSKSIVFRSEY